MRTLDVRRTGAERRRADRPLPIPGEGPGGAIRRRFIGTLAGRAQARRRDAMIKSRTNPLPNVGFPAIRRSADAEVPNGSHADRALRARHPAEHRHDSAARRLPRRRGPHHRAGRLPDHRPRLPPRRHGLSRPGRRSCGMPPGTRSRPGGARAGAAAGPVHHARATGRYLDHAYRPDDILLFGRESAGVPDAGACGGRCAAGRSRCATGLRSLNVAMAAAMAVGEAHAAGRTDWPRLARCRQPITRDRRADRRVRRSAKADVRRKQYEAGRECILTPPGRCPSTRLARWRSVATEPACQIPRDRAEDEQSQLPDLPGDAGRGFCPKRNRGKTKRSAKLSPDVNAIAGIAHRACNVYRALTAPR